MPHDPNYDSQNLFLQKNTGNILPLSVCPWKPISIAQYNTNVWKFFCNNQFKKPFLDHSVQKRVKIKFKSNKNHSWTDQEPMNIEFSEKQFPRGDSGRDAWIWAWFTSTLVRGPGVNRNRVLEERFAKSISVREVWSYCLCDSKHYSQCWKAEPSQR